MAHEFILTEDDERIAVDESPRVIAVRKVVWGTYAEVWGTNPVNQYLAGDGIDYLATE